MSIAELALRFTGAFEAEVLVELLLRHYQHPMADDEGFKNNLLETAATILETSVKGEQYLEGLDPSNMNLIAAVWMAENLSLVEGEDQHNDLHDFRKKWLQDIRHVFPSCFCNQNMLG